MRTDELIVELARSAGPVRPLPSPSIRLARWTVATAPLMALAVIVIGPRADVMAAMSDPAFVGIAGVTILTALLSAASTLVLGIPGAERSMWQRVLPLLAGGLWALALVYLLTIEGSALRRLQQWPFHWLCLIEIVGLSVGPAWALMMMLRRAAPLRKAWAGALAILAAVALGAAATQFLCPLDDPAHQLVGHAFPVAVLALLGALVGTRYLNWMGRA
jgi:hypothetical protein